MAIQGKLLVGMCLVTLASFVANFAVFIACYNFLATPYLQESQREANAGFIMSGAIGLFVATAAITGVAAYFVSRLRKPPEEVESS